ncbi:vacuolar protein sorting-associated protein 35 [Mucor mucedo]|uniref:vacuolar protein sorting-associated protein 35 n=1 Tax=Mucor mucedo TaxID=29922 RepID=UPI0022206131|nr:vacuolar protein sorting-associated protein 35 [Mucor mucedo]KAI7897200.1 vacuolar protein sorting-associated protein 35 [Mucor mucedo]
MGLQTNNEQESLYLKEILSAVSIQSRLMKQCLDKHRLMDGIKHCSNMLAELRTSALTPKPYYELYISVFDSMRYLTDYLRECHETGKHHLGDLYELVQYASSIIPRLYLMITVGSIYLSVKDSPPPPDIMSDMMEMVRGVQHPLRGLFLRHYLGGMTRDFLPNDGSYLDAAIQFILTNFAEMNKLWVRLQHIGHTRDKAKRESERKELGTLVGTNLVRLSQLEGVDLKVYQTDILPGMLSQVINCNDVMAQEYLMEVIIQIFPDEFHMHSLKPFLATTAQLHSKVNIKAIIMSLLDRLTAFAKSEEIEGNLMMKEGTTLFTMFWNEIMELVKTRQDLPVQDQTSLFVSLANFSLSCYSDRLDYIDQILLFTKESIFFKDTADLHSKQSETNVLNLLLAPARTWDVLTLITSLKYYQPLLAMQPYNTRRSVALAILDNILSKETKLEQPQQVYQLLEICHVLIKEESTSTTVSVTQQYYGDEDDRDEKGWVARLVHLFYSDDEDVQFLLLSAARKQLETGSGNRIKAIFPSLIVSSLKLAKRYHKYNKNSHKTDEPEENINVNEWEKKMTTLYRFIHQIIMILYRQGDNTESQCVQFSLMAAQSADYCGFEQIAYDFFLDAFKVYEESVSHSKAQFDAIVYSIGSLMKTSTRFASHYSYSKLSTKITLYCTKLLKKPDQSRSIYLSSHLWVNESPSRVLECLQKSLKIADSCMDTVTNELLFLELLNQYIYYYEQGNPMVTAKYLDGLVELIQSHLDVIDQPDQHPFTANSSSLIEHEKDDIIPYVTRQFETAVTYLKSIKDRDD